MSHFLLPGLLFAASAIAAPGDWPGWRGDGTGVSAEKGFPLEWSATKNVRWNVPVPGFGWSNPVVARGKVFLTTAIFEGQKAPLQKGPPSGEEPPQATIKRIVLCCDAATGKTLWQRTVAEAQPAHGNHPSNTWATETPVTDGGRVFFVFGNVGVFCFDLDGKALWQHPLESHKVFGNWGTASSPVLDGDRLFLVCDNNEASYLLALDTKTGKQVWREKREERSTWSTPLVWRNAKRTELVVMGSSYIRSYEPATGRELWRLVSENGTERGGGPPTSSRGRPPGGNAAAPTANAAPPSPGGAGKGGPGAGGGKAKSGGCKASPTATPEMLYVGMSTRKSEGELGPMWAIRPGATGDISLRDGQTSSKDIAWFRDDAGSHFTSPLVYAGCVYCFPGHDGYPLTVFDAATGAKLYEKELGRRRACMGSPCGFEGKVMCADSGGTAFVIEAGRDFKLLETNALEGMTWSTPSLAGGHIFVRTADRLFCIGK